MKLLIARRLLAVLAAVLVIGLAVPAGVAAAPAPLPVNYAGHATDSVEALLRGAANQQSTATSVTLHRLRTVNQIAHVQNSARARANCLGCRAVAVSIQFVLVDSGDVKPINKSYSVNKGCRDCQALAVARQIVIVIKGDGTFSLAARQRLAALRDELAALDYESTDIDALSAQIDGLADDMAQVIVNGFVGTSDDGIPPEMCAVDPGPGCIGRPSLRRLLINSLAPSAAIDVRGANRSNSLQNGTRRAETLSYARQLVITHGSLRLRKTVIPAHFSNEAVGSTVGLGKAPKLINAGEFDFERALTALEECASDRDFCVQPPNRDSIMVTHAGQWLFGTLPTSFGRNQASTLLVGDAPTAPPEVAALSSGKRLEQYRQASLEAGDPTSVQRGEDGEPSLDLRQRLGGDSPLAQGIGTTSHLSSAGVSVALQYADAPSGTGCQNVAANRVPIPGVLTLGFPSRLLACMSNNLDGTFAANVAADTYVSVTVAESARRMGAPDPIPAGVRALLIGTRNRQGSLGLNVNAGGGEGCGECAVVVSVADQHNVARTPVGAEVAAPPNLEYLVRNSALQQEVLQLDVFSNGTVNVAVQDLDSLARGYPLTAPVTNDIANDDLVQTATQIGLDSDNLTQVSVQDLESDVID